MTINSYLVKSTVVAALGGLLFGFDTAVIAGTTHALTLTYHLTPGTLGITVAAALWGTVLGAMLAGIPGDRYGRRDSLRVMAVLYLISSLGCAFAWGWSPLVFFRFIGGLGIGGSSVLGPMYIAEIAPAKWRGRLVGFFQFNVVFGILLAYLSNYLLGLLQLGDIEWRWKLGVAAVPAVFFFLMLFVIPRSPRWLVKKQRIDEAREVLPPTRACSPGNTAFRSFWRSPLACSINCPALMPFFTISTTSLPMPGSARFRETCRRSPSAARIYCSPCSR
jgi:MFS family permease